MNTIVSAKLVESESSKTIYNFLKKSLRNQPRISIGTDLKHEYREAIDKLHIKHHFCRFHVKQKINRDLKNYLKINKPSTKEIEEINKVKQTIFDILDPDNMKTAKTLKNELLNNKNIKNKFIYKILWKFTIPYFKKLTYHIENTNIESTNNKIENIFQKVFTKHIKKTMKTEKRTFNQIQPKIRTLEYKKCKLKKTTQVFERALFYSEIKFI